MTKDLTTSRIDLLLHSLRLISVQSVAILNKIMPNLQKMDMLCFVASV